jgi:hypothetical protein
MLLSLARGRFHLHAQESPSGFHYQIVPAAVSPRFDYAQAMLRRSRHKKQFSPLSPQLELAAVGLTVSEHGIVLEIENAARKAAPEN